MTQDTLKTLQDPTNALKEFLQTNLVEKNEKQEDLFENQDKISENITRVTQILDHIPETFTTTENNIANLCTDKQKMPHVFKHPQKGLTST